MGFFDSVVSGISNVGSAVESGIKTVGTDAYSGVKTVANDVNTAANDALNLANNFGNNINKGIGGLVNIIPLLVLGGGAIALFIIWKK